MINVLIIDDDKIICESLEKIISSEKDYFVVGKGYSYEDAIHLYRKLKPDVILLDIRLGKLTGIDAARDILLQYKNAKILFISTFSEEEYILEAIEIGAKGYIVKHDIEKVITSINSVYNGQVVFGNEIYEKLPLLVRKNNKNEKHNLSATQLEIIEYLALGLNNKEIASKLFLGEGTIRNYISNLLNKLNLRNRTELAAFYYNHIKQV